MKEYTQEKMINGLSVERRNRLATISIMADAHGLSFKLISEHLVANTEETDKLIEEAENTLKEFIAKKEEYNRKLEELASKVFSSKQS